MLGVEAVVVGARWVRGVQERRDDRQFLVVQFQILGANKTEFVVVELVWRRSGNEFICVPCVAREERPLLKGARPVGEGRRVLADDAASPRGDDKIVEDPRRPTDAVDFVHLHEAAAPDDGIVVEPRLPGVSRVVHLLEKRDVASDEDVVGDFSVLDFAVVVTVAFDRLCAVYNAVRDEITAGGLLMDSEIPGTGVKDVTYDLRIVGKLDWAKR